MILRVRLWQPGKEGFSEWHWYEPEPHPAGLNLFTPRGQHRCRELRALVRQKDTPGPAIGSTRALPGDREALLAQLMQAAAGSIEGTYRQIRNITQVELAKELGCDPRTLRNTLKEVAGLSWKEYVQELTAAAARN